jgi:hypothetical protein
LLTATPEINPKRQNHENIGFFGLRPGRYRHSDYLAGRSLYKQTFRKMSLNDSVLSENVLNEEEQALNSLIPEKSKGRRCLSEIIETLKQGQDLNKVTSVNESDVGVFS